MDQEGKTFLHRITFPGLKKRKRAKAEENENIELTLTVFALRNRIRSVSATFCYHLFMEAFVESSRRGYTQ